MVTINYLDKFGRPKQFVFCEWLSPYCQGQSHDAACREHMRRLSITKARIAYHDYRLIHRDAPKRLLPTRKQRTITL